jgi:hypothetical protein
MTRPLQSAALGLIVGFCVTQWATTGRDQFATLALAGGLLFWYNLIRES